jgi:hypothetical protein
MTDVLHRFAVMGLVLWVLAAPAEAQSAKSKPPVPSGPPTRGMAVALLTTGVDYTKPGIATRLARDGEGELIAWDTLANDRKPFASIGDGTGLVALASTFVVPIRIDPTLPQSAVDAIAFVRRTPARVVVIPMTWRERQQAEPLLKAMKAAPDLLFIVSAGDDDLSIDAEPVFPASVGMEHMIVVGALPPAGSTVKPNRGLGIDLVLVPPAAAREAPGGARQPPRTSAEAAIMLPAHFLCAASELAKAGSAAEVKRLLIGKAKPDARSASPLLETCAPR